MIQLRKVVFRNNLKDNNLILSIKNKSAIENLIQKECPDIILNRIKVLINGSLLHPDNAILINAYFPYLIERLASEVNAKLIHISTDCVFSGKKGIIQKRMFVMLMTTMIRTKVWARGSTKKILRSEHQFSVRN